MPTNAITTNRATRTPSLAVPSPSTADATTTCCDDTVDQPKPAESADDPIAQFIKLLNAVVQLLDRLDSILSSGSKPEKIANDLEETVDESSPVRGGTGSGSSPSSVGGDVHTLIMAILAKLIDFMKDKMLAKAKEVDAATREGPDSMDGAGDADSPEGKGPEELAAELKRMQDLLGSVTTLLNAINDKAGQVLSRVAA